MNKTTTGCRLIQLDKMTQIIANCHSDDAIIDWNYLTSNSEKDVFEAERFERMAILADIALKPRKYKKCVRYVRKVLKLWAKAVENGMNVECPIKAN